MTQQCKPAARRLPCLDGIRGISIALVLLSHLVGTLNGELPPFLTAIGKMGNLGVRIFFVISGYLITSLLILEYRKTGSISLLKFYFNRTFRIFPAFYAFIAAIVLADYIGFITLKSGDLLHAVTYTTNYHHDRAWELGHLWSLAVEEQFYLLWPAIFLCFGIRGAFCASTAYLVIGPLVRVLTWKYLPEHREGIGESFQTVADSIATGCTFVLLEDKLAHCALYSRVQRNAGTFLGLVALILLLNHFRGYISLMYPFGETLLNVSIVLAIDWCLRNSEGGVGSFLNSRPLVFVGVLSYSLYLWQQPFMNRHNNALIAEAPVNIICALLLAALSYYLVETPFLSMRAKISRNWIKKSTTAIASRTEPALD